MPIPSFISEKEAEGEDQNEAEAQESAFTKLPTLSPVILLQIQTFILWST